MKRDWRRLASCLNVGLDLFYHDGSGRNPNLRRAKSMCGDCPVRKICLEDAMQHEQGMSADQRFGVWGGLTNKERFNLAKERGERVVRAVRGSKLEVA